MFSVPGWNLSSRLKAQTEVPSKAQAAQNGEGNAPKNKKRKRGQGKKEEVNVDRNNFTEVWENVIEGKEAPAEGKSGKKQKKNRHGKDRGSLQKQGANGIQEKAELKSLPGPTRPSSTMETSKDKKSKKDKPSKATDSTTASAPAFPSIPPPLPVNSKLTPLQQSMRAKLAGARFRHLNESLYTTPSADSLSLFKSNPKMFNEYHTGFAQQVGVWPENPVDAYLQDILTRGKIRSREPFKDKRRKGKDTDAREEDILTKTEFKPLPRGLKYMSTLADLGCGTASLSLSLQPHLRKLNLTIHSFDLAQPSGPAHDLVTVADIANLPLPDASVDVAIFCLALMGTNWLDFIDEAYRILRWRGELWIAEIKSRFGRVGRVKGPPVNSVGSLRKGGPMPSKRSQKKEKKGKGQKEEEGIAGEEDEEELAERVDGVETRQGETDVGAFVEVLRRRGFLLDRDAEEAVDLRNKMFVKMRFVKAAPPTRGKNVKAEEDKGRAGRKRFVEVEGEVDEEVEARTLKPCVYKIR